MALQLSAVEERKPNVLVVYNKTSNRVVDYWESGPLVPVEDDASSLTSSRNWLVSLTAFGDMTSAYFQIDGTAHPVWDTSTGLLTDVFRDQYGISLAQRSHYTPNEILVPVRQRPEDYEVDPAAQTIIQVAKPKYELQVISAAGVTGQESWSGPSWGSKGRDLVPGDGTSTIRFTVGMYDTSTGSLVVGPSWDQHVEMEVSAGRIDDDRFKSLDSATGKTTFYWEVPKGSQECTIRFLYICTMPPCADGPVRSCTKVYLCEATGTN